MTIEPKAAPYEDWRDWVARGVVWMGMILASTVASAVVVGWLTFTVRLWWKVARWTWLWSLLAVVFACTQSEPPMRPHWKYTCTNADTVHVPVAVLHEDDEYNPLVVLKVPLVFCVRRDSVWVEPELEKDDTLDAAMIPKDTAR